MNQFVAHEDNSNGWNPTFKIQGQVYHTVGSLLPQEGTPVFLQIYFLGTESEEINRRSSMYSDYLRLNHATLRAEEYGLLRDAVENDNNGRLVVPSSFTGGPRYMHEHAQDTMVYVRQRGVPDLFINFTCNPEWEEISRELFTGQTHTDRVDIVARVFRQKDGLASRKRLASHVMATPEIESYQTARYLGPSEGIWRLNGLPIHERYPTVEKLGVHLEDGQIVFFRGETSLQAVAEQAAKTTLTEYFELCKTDPLAKTLLYSEIPKYFRWLKNENLEREVYQYQDSLSMWQTLL
ncbi:hypothetical protein WDU94_010658 [Cyamophila willieti]